jgi:condensin complex subunit 2
MPSSRRNRRLSGKVPAITDSGLDMIENAIFDDQENAGGFGANNDDEERRQRRRSFKKNRRRSARFSLGGNGIRKQVGNEPSILTESELTSMYKTTIAMSTQNKINSKNAFQLQLIDRINQVVDVVTGTGTSSSEANENAFQHAGCVVEAAAKIYDARVDETYKGTQRFISDLARTAKNGNNDAAEDESLAADPETAKAKGSKRLGVAKTLETNLNSINICKTDLECDVNPLFEKMSQKFDEGGARGLLLGNVPISDGPKIVIGGIVAADIEEEQQQQQQQQNQQDSSSTAADPSEPTMFSLQMDTNQFCQLSSTRKLCTDTASFYNWYDMYTGQDNSTDSSSSFSSSFSSNSHQLDQDERDGSDIFDDDDDDYAAGDMFDDFGNDDMGDDYGLCDESNNTCNSNNGGISEESGPNVAMPGRSAYSYYQMPTPSETTANWANKKSNWAGQGHNKHWKLFDTPSNSSSDTASKKKQSAPKEVFTLDFTAEPIDIKKAFCTSRAATTLSQKSLDEQYSNLKSYLLPDDAHYEMKDLQRLFFRPTAFVRAAKQKLSENGEDGNNDGFGDMSADDDWGGDDWGGDDDMAFGEDASSAVFVSAASEDDLDLVEDANKTERIDIDYATTRKVFDIKQLKGEFWTHLSVAAPHKPECKEIFENVEEETPEIMNKKIDEVFDGAATFSGTLDKVKIIFFLFQNIDVFFVLFI